MLCEFHPHKNKLKAPTAMAEWGLLEMPGPCTGGTRWRDCLSLGCQRGGFAQGGLILIWVASRRWSECTAGRGSDGDNMQKSEHTRFVWGTWIFLQVGEYGRLEIAQGGKKARHLLRTYYVTGGMLKALCQLGHLILPITWIFFFPVLTCDETGCEWT